MSDAPTPPTPPAAPGTDPPFSAWELLAEGVGKVPLVGGLLKVLVQKRQTRALLAVLLFFWVFVLYPLLVPVIAAGLINNGALFGLHDGYAATVRSAFRVKEEVDRSTQAANRVLNARLDYFYPVDFVGDPRDSKNYEFPVSPLQKLVLRIERAQLRSRAPADECPVPEALTRSGATLMTVEIGNQAMLKVRNDGSRDSLVLTKETWDKLSQAAGKERLSLTFEPVPELQKINCRGLEIEVRATVEVFKELL